MTDIMTPSIGYFVGQEIQVGSGESIKVLKAVDISDVCPKISFEDNLKKRPRAVLFFFKWSNGDIVRLAHYEDRSNRSIIEGEDFIIAQPGDLAREMVFQLFAKTKWGINPTELDAVIQRETPMGGD